MKCKKVDCHYRSKFEGKIEFCDYIGIAGVSRRCDPEKCDKYKKREKPRTKGGISISTNTEQIKIYNANKRNKADL